MSNAQNWAGKALGLPQNGSGSLAKFPRRLLALVIDWFVALLISTAFFASDNSATLLIFAGMQFILVLTLGASFGHRITGMKVRKVDGSTVGLVSSAFRVGLILLVLPAVIWDNDNRGLHDKAAGTVLIRA